jgi:hypothetical protein
VSWAGRLVLAAAGTNPTRASGRPEDERRVIVRLRAGLPGVMGRQASAGGGRSDRCRARGSFEPMEARMQTVPADASTALELRRWA